MTILPVNDAPAESATEKAAKEALANIQSGGSAIPRNPDGTFAPKAGDAPPAAGQATEGDEPEGDEGQPAPAPAAAPKGTETPPAPKPSEEPAAGDETAAGEKPLVVELVDRNGRPMELELGDEQTADMVRSYVNAAERGRVAELQLGEATQLLDTYAAEREEMFADPVGFMARSGITANPAMVEHVILALATEHWDKVRDRLLALDDPQELRAVKWETKSRQAELSGEVRESLAEQRAVNQNLAEINSAVDTLRPAGLSAAQTRVFETACLTAIKAYADRYNLMTVPADQLPEILGETLEAYDIDADTAAELLGHAAPPRGGRRPSAAPARPVARPAAPAAPAPKAPPRAAAPAHKPAPNGKQFVASARRKAAAASPPAGAGSPSTGPIAPPTGKGIEATIAWHRANRGRLSPNPR